MLFLSRSGKRGKEGGIYTLKTAAASCIPSVLWACMVARVSAVLILWYL